MHVSTESPMVIRRHPGERANLDAHNAPKAPSHDVHPTSFEGSYERGLAQAQVIAAGSHLGAFVRIVCRKLEGHQRSPNAHTCHAPHEAVGTPLALALVAE